MSRNPRYANGNARRKLRARLRAEGRPCWICGAFGRPSTIDYSLPAGHPMAFEVDELVPISKGGNPLDYSNLASTHRCCNEWRKAKTVEEVMLLARASREGPSDECSREWGF